MRLLKILLLPIFLLTLSLNIAAQNVTISDAVITADGSAILEIQSTTKGVLVSRLTSEQKNAVSSPANGLLVYDTVTKSFWYFDTAWKEIGAADGSLISDSDTDTRVETEKNTDEDKIRFSTAGNERMQLDENGNLLVGDASNYTKIESDGTITLHGTATVYDDLLVPVSSTTRGGSKDPDFAVFKANGSGSQGVFAYYFDSGTEEELFFVAQMPHKWLEGSTIFPHVHWAAPSTPSGTNVEWGLEYTWSNVGSDFGNSTIITAYTPLAACGTVTAYKHIITELSPITATGQTLSSILVCRVFRKAASTHDDYPDNAILLEIDFHYEINSLGSSTEYEK